MAGEPLLPLPFPGGRWADAGPGTRRCSAGPINSFSPGWGPLPTRRRSPPDRLDRVIREEAAQGKPILGICLGMQLLFEESRSLALGRGGLLPGKVVPMGGVVPQAPKFPHIGWNGLHFPAGRRHPLLAGVEEGTVCILSSSFYAAECDDVVIATAGMSFTAENVMGCQFHPEKSGTVGLSILKTFCEGEW